MPLPRPCAAAGPESGGRRGTWKLNLLEVTILLGLDGPSLRRGAGEGGAEKGRQGYRRGLIKDRKGVLRGRESLKSLRNHKFWFLPVLLGPTNTANRNWDKLYKCLKEI